MYKYYKNIGRERENLGEVLHKVVDCFDEFLNSLYSGNIISDDYKLEYLFDPVTDGSNNFDASFDLSNNANLGYKAFAFKFSWMNHPIILFVPKKIKCVGATEYNNFNDGVDNYDQAVLTCSFNPKAFSSSNEYSEFYSSERVFNSMSPAGYVNVPLEPGISYYDVTTELDPLWLFRPFYHGVSTSDSMSSYLEEDTSMFISVVNHTFIFGFVMHSDIDIVYYYVISSMDSYKYLPDCDLVGDYFIKYSSTCFKKLGVSEDIIHFTQNAGRITAGSEDRYFSVVSAKLDANINGSSLYCQMYMPLYYYSFKCVTMFDNLEHISLPVSKFNKSLGIIGDNRAYTQRGMPYLLLSTPLPYAGNPGELKLPIFPNDSHDRFASYYASPLQGDYTYYTFPFPCDEQNTLNNHIFIYPLLLYVAREPLTSTISAYCKLDFMGITDVMYKNDRDLHELCVNENTYLVFENTGGSRDKYEYQIALLVDCKLEPAI